MLCRWWGNSLLVHRDRFRFCGASTNCTEQHQLKIVSPQSLSCTNSWKVKAISVFVLKGTNRSQNRKKTENRVIVCSRLSKAKCENYSSHAQTTKFMSCVSRRQVTGIKLHLFCTFALFTFTYFLIFHFHPLHIHLKLLNAENTQSRMLEHAVNEQKLP